MYGVPQIQPDAVIMYLRAVFCLVPLSFALTSFYLKSFFIMKTRSQVELIGTSIAKHLLGLPGVCPFSGTTTLLYRYAAGVETRLVGLLGHFHGVETIASLLVDGGAPALQAATRGKLRKYTAYFCVLLLSVVASCWYARL
jgi:hypothetical protein